jgi:SpoVK/Ycf46/Vps4 family AAA+-type ATPase
MDMVLDSRKGLVSVKELVYKSILLPRIKNKRGIENLPSAICLFGPPGTGKTTLSSTIAKTLGWSFVRIEPSTFVKEGMDKFAQRVEYVFDCLKHLEKTVILFDEMDEYIKKRVIESDNRSKSSSPDFFNRLSTNIFLTQIDKLYKFNKNIIYLIATNNIDDIDKAITRDDRIDFKIFIDFIYPKELLGMLEEKIKGLIDTEKNTKLENYYYHNKKGYENFKDILEKELISKSISYKKWVRFIDIFIQLVENNANEDDIINEIRQNFSEIDHKYLELRKEQHQKNRIDSLIIKECEYKGYNEFILK